MAVNVYKDVIDIQFRYWTGAQTSPSDNFS